MQQILAIPDQIKWHRTGLNVFAYVYPGGPVEIWFGPLFWRAPMTGTDSKAGTVIHELSHELGVTQDHVYGTAAASALALSNPDLAIHNADNYEYFAEGVP
jgi:peptidyl-Lys metalloendopeptidase